MPKFEKGKPKTGGRKKGTPNKMKSIVRPMLLKITNEDKFWQKFIMELFSLEGREFTHACKEMFEFIEPKLQAMALDDNSESARSRVIDLIAAKREEDQETNED